MKIYVAVELTIDEAGVMHPQCVVWEDGRKFEITAILDVRRADALSRGGNRRLLSGSLRLVSGNGYGIPHRLGQGGGWRAEKSYSQRVENTIIYFS